MLLPAMVLFAPLTIPGVVGPYTNVSATLRLGASWTRTEPSDAALPVQDTVAVSQAAIATSSANGDGGAFELNFNDSRYLPFEGAGAISTWSLELPSSIRPFDYSTISDVVMHVSYTAREGDTDFKTSVSTGLLKAMNDQKLLLGADATMSRLFSLRQEFPDAWHRLMAASDGSPRTCTLQLGKQHFPSFLDYEWPTASDGTIQPIKLVVTGLKGHLSPHGAMPKDAGRIVLNSQQAQTDTELGVQKFDLRTVPPDLSSTTIHNHTVVDCVLTMDGELRAEDWNDLYLLMDYDVRIED